MKIGFTVTFHESQKIKSDGHVIGHKFIKALYDHCTFPFELFIIDNQSEPQFPMERYEHLTNIHYTYVENQYLTGVTGAWNLGAYQAYENGCDLINICNNDLYFNDTLDTYLSIILKDGNIDNTIFAPVTDGINPQHIQHYKAAQKGIHEAVGNRGGLQTLCGIMYTFTPNFYKQYGHTEEEFIPLEHKYNEGDGKWGGQEGAVMIMWENGAVMKVIKQGWFHHDKLFSYRTAKKIEITGGN